MLSYMAVRAKWIVVAVEHLIKPPIHAVVFAMLLLCYGGLRKLVPKFASPLPTHATVFTQSCELQWLVRMSLQWKNFNEDTPFVQLNLNLASGLRILDKFHPHMLLFWLWYSHTMSSMFWYCYVMVMLWFSPDKCPIHATFFARVDWTIT